MGGQSRRNSCAKLEDRSMEQRGIGHWRTSTSSISAVREAPWAREALDELARSPMSNPSLLHAALFPIWHKAIPSRLATHRAIVRKDVVAFASEAVRNSCQVLQERDRANDERDAERLRELYGVIDESVAHVYFCLSREHSRMATRQPEARREFFGSVSPILNRILTSA